MSDNAAHLLHANALRADILAAPEVWLPRRDTMLDWLNSFLERAAGPKYDLADTEAADLTALDRYLRHSKVAAAA